MQADSPASRTALLVAGYRARATARPEKVCDDPWARALAGDEGLALTEDFDSRFPHMELWLALRTRFLDDAVRHATEREGVRQIVVLGAGLDTRAERLARDGVCFFEVDHPATQADKRARLEALDGYPIDAAVYASCDFESGQDFLTQLEGAGFDAGAPAVILWEGVVPYLSEAAVRATARRVATGCHPASPLYFDFLGKKMAGVGITRDKDIETRAWVGDLGEPIQFGSNHILPLLYEEGFRHVRQLSFDEIALHYTGTYERAREFRFQHLAAAAVTPPARLV